MKTDGLRFGFAGAVGLAILLLVGRGVAGEPGPTAVVYGSLGATLIAALLSPRVGAAIGLCGALVAGGLYLKVVPHSFSLGSLAKTDCGSRCSEQISAANHDATWIRLACGVLMLVAFASLIVLLMARYPRGQSR